MNLVYDGGGLTVQFVVVVTDGSFVTSILIGYWVFYHGFSLRNTSH